jgi:uncharacterized Zn finger protein (UPF0148 family)
MTDASSTTRELKSDHCPDCGGPIVTADSGERGCWLCGVFLPEADPVFRTPRPR